MKPDSRHNIWRLSKILIAITIMVSDTWFLCNYGNSIAMEYMCFLAYPLIGLYPFSLSLLISSIFDKSLLDLEDECIYKEQPIKNKILMKNPKKEVDKTRPIIEEENHFMFLDISDG